MAASGKGGMVKIWDWESERAIQSFQETNGDVYALAFTKDNLRLASTSNKGAVQIWKVESGQALIPTFNPTPGSSLGPIVFLSDGKRLAIPTQHGSVELLDTETGQSVMSLRIPRGLVSRTTVSRTGAQLAVSHENGTIYIWDTIRRK